MSGNTTIQNRKRPGLSARTLQKAYASVAPRGRCRRNVQVYTSKTTKPPKDDRSENGHRHGVTRGRCQVRATNSGGTDDGRSNTIMTRTYVVHRQMCASCRLRSAKRTCSRDEERRAETHESRTTCHGIGKQTDRKRGSWAISGKRTADWQKNAIISKTK